MIWHLHRCTILALTLVATVTAVAQPASAQPARSQRASGQPRKAPGLVSLPRLKAVPINSGVPVTDAAPTALTAPFYCDSETLQSSATLRAIRFRDAGNGIAVGDHGSIVVTADGGLTWKRATSGVSCRLDDCIWLSERRVVAVGGGYDWVTRITRGCILVSDDAGVTWSRGQDSELPRLTQLRLAENSRRTTVVAIGDRDPVTGYSTFESTNGGVTWSSTQSVPSTGTTATEASEAAAWAEVTGHAMTVRASCRLPDGVAMAIGDHGQILRSSDEGKTWQRVHGDGSCAILFVAKNVQSIPWSLIGRECLELRQRVGVLVGGDPESMPSAAQAAMQLGVASLDAYPSGSQAAPGALAAWLDVHRPAVLVIDAALPQSLRTVLLQQAVSREAQKVVEYSRSADRGEAALHFSAVLPRSGVLAGDLEADGQLLIDRGQLNRANHISGRVSYDTVYSSAVASSVGAAIGDGVRLLSEHRLPPRVSVASRRRLQVLRGRLKQQETIVRLLDRRTSAEFAESIAMFLDQTDREDRFRAAWTIAALARRHDAELLVWSEVAKRFGAASAGKLARLHADCRASSEEWKRFSAVDLSLSDSDLPSPETPSPWAENNELSPVGGQHSAAVSPFQSVFESAGETPSGVVQASAVSPITVPPLRAPSAPGDPIVEAAGESKVDLSWEMHPVRLLAAHAMSRSQSEAPIQDNARGKGLSADLKRVASRETAWSDLLKPISSKVTVAAFTRSPPLLDGRLEEGIWRNAAQSRGDAELQIRAAHDDHFVYLAVRTPAAVFQRPDTPSGPIGQRDTDVRRFDRVYLGIDLDLDLLTSLDLQFTRDGRTHDSIDGRQHWNPLWYVASRESGGVVSTEIAIKKSSFGDAVDAGDQWFINADVFGADQPTTLPWMPRPETRVRIDFR